jgi:alpha-glucosidase (family GH31 glycosyl hydrolase)
MKCKMNGKTVGMLPAVLIAGAAMGQSWTVDTDRLQLQVSGSGGYGFTVLDKSTNQLLIDQAQTRVDGSSVTGISNVVQTGDALSGILSLQNGKSARVQFQFTENDVLKVNLAGQGFAPETVREQFVDNGERYYGVWENGYENRHLDNDGLGFNISGVRERDGWNFSGDDDDIDQVYAASARAPFYMTDRGVGVYAETAARGRFEFDQNNRTGFEFQTNKLQYTEDPAMPDGLTYHIIAGDYKQILGDYNEIAGPSFRPPDWAYGSIWWRDDHNDVPSFTGASNAQELVLRDAQLLRDLQIPATSVWIDRPYTTDNKGFGGTQFDRNDFPDPAAMAQSLADQNLKLMVWIANWHDNYLANAPESAGNAVDMRDAMSRQFYQDYLDMLGNDAQLADGGSGIFGYKIDRGGEGAIPDDLQNLMVQLFQQMVFEQLQAEHGDDFFFFSRSVNDKSRRYSAHWNGDPDTTWKAYEHSVLNVIRSGLINQPFWGSDTGGYRGDPGVELFARWFAFSAFTPMMEVKFDDNREREFYDDPNSQIVQIARKYVTEHHMLIPYVRSLMDENIRTGVAPVRAMILEFQDDPNVADMGDQYMYGSHLLVAPVIEDNASTRDVYLPEGEWIDYFDPSKRYQSTGQTITVDTSLDEIPVFARAGAIIPRGDIIQGNNNWTADWAPYLDVEIFLPSATDAANSFGYWTGQNTEWIAFEKSADGLVVSFGDLLLDGDIVLYLDALTESNLLSEVWSVIMDGQLLGLDDYLLSDGVLRVAYEGPTVLQIAVPEPGMLMLAGLGGVALLARRRRP